MASASTGVRAFCEEMAKILENYGAFSLHYTVTVQREGSGQVTVNLVDRRIQEIVSHTITPSQCTQLSMGQWLWGVLGGVQPWRSVVGHIIQLQLGMFSESAEASTIIRAVMAEEDGEVRQRVLTAIRRTSPFQRILDVLNDPPIKKVVDDFCSLRSDSCTIFRFDVPVPMSAEAAAPAEQISQGYDIARWLRFYFHPEDKGKEWRSLRSLIVSDSTLEGYKLRAIALAVSHAVLVPIKRYIESQLLVSNRVCWKHFVTREIHLCDTITIIQKVVSKIVPKRGRMVTDSFETNWSLTTKLDGLARLWKVELEGDSAFGIQNAGDERIDLLKEIRGDWERDVVGDIQALFDRPETIRVCEEVRKRIPFFEIFHDGFSVDIRKGDEDQNSGIFTLFEFCEVDRQLADLFVADLRKFVEAYSSVKQSSYLVSILLASTVIPFQLIADVLLKSGEKADFVIKDPVRINMQESLTVVTQTATLNGVGFSAELAMEICISRVGKPVHVSLSAPQHILALLSSNSVTHTFLLPIYPLPKEKSRSHQVPMKAPLCGITIVEDRHTEKITDPVLWINQLLDHFNVVKCPEGFVGENSKKVSALLFGLSPLFRVEYTLMLEYIRPSSPGEEWKHETLSSEITVLEGTASLRQRFRSHLSLSSTDLWGNLCAFDVASVLWEQELVVDVSGAVIFSKVAVASNEGMPIHRTAWGSRSQVTATWERSWASQIAKQLHSTQEKRSIIKDLACCLEHTEIVTSDFMFLGEEAPLIKLLSAFHIDPEFPKSEPILPENPLYNLCTIFGDGLSPVVANLFQRDHLLKCLRLQQETWDHTVLEGHIHVFGSKQHEVLQKRKAVARHEGQAVFEIVWQLKAVLDPQGVVRIATSVDMIKGWALTEEMGRAAISLLTSTWTREESSHGEPFPLFNFSNLQKNNNGPYCSHQGLYMSTLGLEAPLSAAQSASLEKICSRYFDVSRIEALFPGVESLMYSRHSEDEGEGRQSIFHDVRTNIFFDQRCVCYTVHSLLYAFEGKERESLLKVALAYEWEIAVGLNEKQKPCTLRVTPVKGDEGFCSLLEDFEKSLCSSYGLQPLTVSVIYNREGCL